MEQLVYQYIHIILTYAITFILQSDLFLRALKSQWIRRLSACLLINIGLCVATAFYGIFNYGYLLLMLNEKKDAAFIFYLSHTFNAVNFGRSTSTSLLVVDRCLCLRTPVKYQKNYSLIVWAKVFLCFLAILLHSIIQAYVEWPIEGETECNIPLCLLKKDAGFVSGLMRISIALISLVGSFVFYQSIRHHALTSKATNKNQFSDTNKLIAISVAGEVILNLLPNVIKISSALFSLQIWTSLGPLYANIYAVDSLFNALVYRHLLKKPLQRTKTSSTKEVVHGTRRATTGLPTL